MNAFISPLEALFILLILTTARSEIMNLAHKPFPWNPANIQQMPTWLVQMITNYCKDINFKQFTLHS